MRKYLQFNIVLVLLVSFFVTICLAKNVSIWVILLSSQVLLIQILVAVLCRSIPHSLTKASRDNCYRLSGSISPRRESRERKALSEIRGNLNAVLIIVALSGNWLVLMIDTLVIPLPLATESLAAFSFDANSWREEISDRNLDREYATWRGLGQLGNSEILEQPHFVKTSFPILFGLTLGWIMVSCAFIRNSYLRTMRDFYAGIRSRSTEYLNLDIGRMQE